MHHQSVICFGNRIVLAGFEQHSRLANSAVSHQQQRPIERQAQREPSRELCHLLQSQHDVVERFPQQLLVTLILSATDRVIALVGWLTLAMMMVVVTTPVAWRGLRSTTTQ